jgi:uncharacterized protein (TIGR03437 family)
MRSLHIYPLLAFIFAAVGGAQIVLDPSPARVLGHPSTTPAEQLFVTNLNPNFGANGGLYSPQGVALDTSVSPPILYVADTLNNRILAWLNASSATLAKPQQPPVNPQPPDLIIGQPDPYTTLPALNGGLESPRGLVVDASGNLYVADTGNNRVLRYPLPFANKTAVPGSSTSVDNKADLVIGQADMFTPRSPNRGGTVANNTLSLSVGIAVYSDALAMDSSGNLWVVDPGNQRVLQYTAASLTPANSGLIAAATVIGQAGFTVVNQPSSQYDRNTLYTPSGIAFDSAGDLFVSDSYGGRLLVFVPVSGAFSNGMAASRLAGIVNPPPSTPTNSTLYTPEGLVMINNGPGVVDATGNRLLVFDAYSSPDWGLASGDTTFANPPPKALAVLGQGSSLTNFSSIAANDGNIQGCASPCIPGAEVATFSEPIAAAVSPNGDLFVADTGNNRVLVYPSAGTVAAATQVLGQSDFPYDSPNSIHGREFDFGSPSSSADAGIAVAVDSNTGIPHFYVSDPNNHRVLGFADARTVGPGAQAAIVIGEPDMSTAVCNFGGVTNGPTESLPRQPTNASLCYPTGLAVDPSSGDLYVADSDNGRVLRFPAPFAPANALQQANLVLGQTGFTGISNPQPSQSVMAVPYGLVFDPQRGLFVSDVVANRVLLFPISASTTNGEPASTVIGQPNFSSVTKGALNAPHHIAEDTVAELYVADSANNRITIFNIPNGTSTNTPISTYTGLYSPQAVWVNQNPVVGPTNDIWVGDAANGLSRWTVPNPLGANAATLTMPAAEVAGPNLACTGSICSYPAIAITQDSYGALYVADASNRVAIHYPALAGTNGASFVCAMGCNLGGLTGPVNPAGLAPGAFASLYLFNGLPFASGTASSGIPYSTTVGGVQVLVNGTASPVQYVSSSQINFVVPFATPTSVPAQTVVVNAATSQVLGSGSLYMNSADPGFFILNAASGQTPAAGQIAALNCNTIVNGSCDDAVNGPANPANPGSVIQLFLTGQGAGLVPSAPPDGQGSTGQVTTSSQPVVYIGGSQGTLKYSGLAPGYPGLWQINVQIPSGTNLTNLTKFPAGTYPVQVYYEGLTTNIPANNPIPAFATTIAINGPE